MEIFYPVVGKTVNVENKGYVSSAELGGLVDKNNPHVIANFVRVADFEWFPDDPVPGSERSAFRGSKIEGPYFSVKEEEVKTRLSRTPKNQRGEVIQRVLPESRADSRPYHFKRNSLFMGVFIEDVYNFCRSKSEDKIKELIDQVYDTFYKKFPEDKWSIGPNNTKIFPFNKQLFLETDFSKHHFIGVLIDSFGKDPGYDLKGLLEKDAEKFYTETGVFGDISFSSEDFVTFNEIVDLSNASSLEDALKSNDFIPGEPVLLGKR